MWCFRAKGIDILKDGQLYSALLRAESGFEQGVDTKKPKIDKAPENQQKNHHKVPWEDFKDQRNTLIGTAIWALKVVTVIQRFESSIGGGQLSWDGTSFSSRAVGEQLGLGVIVGLFFQGLPCFLEAFKYLTSNQYPFETPGGCFEAEIKTKTGSRPSPRGSLWRSAKEEPF